MTDKAISPLRRRLIEDMTIRRLGPGTQHQYIRHVKSFADFVGRSPDKATPEDVRRYQLRLASSPMPIGPAISHWPAGFSAYPTQPGRTARTTAPKIVTKTPSGTPALAAAGLGSLYDDHSPAARRGSVPPQRSG